MRSSEGSSNSTQRKRLNILKVAEYTSLAASIVGVVISTASQQVVYAAVPLSTSLFLNIINRQRFEQQAQHNIKVATSQVDRQLAQINQGFSRLQDQNFAELEQQIIQLEARLASSQQVQRTYTIAIARVEERLVQIVQSFSREIQTIQQQIQAQNTVINQSSLQLIKQGLFTLENRINSLESLNLGLVSEKITQLQSQYESLPASNSQVDNLQAELNKLQSSLQQQQTDLQAAITQLRSELEALIHQSPSARVFPEEETLAIAPVTPSIEAKSTVDSLLSFLDDDIDFYAEDEKLELELLDINLGIDFGTSFTKVCFRDVARDRSEIVTFTDDKADLNEALLPTKIAVLNDGTLIAGLTTTEWQDYQPLIKTSIEYIKMRLANLDIAQNNDLWRLEQLPELKDSETIENLCAYYLSRVITRSQAWIRNHKAELITNYKIEWAANVGVPVEYCDSPALARFEKVLSLAWLLSNEPQTKPFTLESLSDRLKELKAKLGHVPIDCHAVPEISAAVWSFLNSRQAREGFYAFFDVGCGTLDGVSFRYWREDGEPKVDFYSGFVKPLGVTAISKALANELNTVEAQVKTAIFNPNHSESIDINGTQSRRQIQQLVAKVVMEGRQKHAMHRPDLQQSEFKNGLKLFIGGGGGKTDFYTNAIIDTHADFQHDKVGIPTYKKVNIPSAKDLSMSGLNAKEFYRFAVAYGLSIPNGDCPEVRLPSQISPDN